MTGTPADLARAFDRAFRELDARIKIFTSLRFDQLDHLALRQHLDDIGRVKAASTS